MWIVANVYPFPEDMEQDHGSVRELQMTMKELDLQPRVREGRLISDTVLVGKMLSTRIYRRFTILEII